METARLYPEKFVKSSLFYSPFLQKIQGKVEKMHVLSIGYKSEIKRQEGKAKLFRKIQYIPYELHQNGTNYSIQKLEAKKIKI